MCRVFGRRGLDRPRAMDRGRPSVAAGEFGHARRRSGRLRRTEARRYGARSCLISWTQRAGTACGMGRTVRKRRERERGRRACRASLKLIAVDLLILTCRRASWPAGVPASSVPCPAARGHPAEPPPARWLGTPVTLTCLSPAGVVGPAGPIP